MTPEQMQQKIEDLEFKINMLIKPDVYLFQRDIEFLGTHIGKSATKSKIGFFGVTPVVQPLSTGEINGMTAPGGTNATNQSTFTGNYGSTAWTMSDIVKALKQLGLILK